MTGKWSPGLRSTGMEITMPETRWSKCMKEYRKQTGLTQMVLASKVGVTVSTIANIENGRTLAPSHLLAETFKKLGLICPEA